MKMFHRLLINVLLVVLLAGVGYAQDIELTAEPTADVTEVSVEVVSTTVPDVVVEEGGTVIINQPATTEAEPEASEVIIAKIAAFAVLVLSALRYIAKGVTALFKAFLGNTIAVTIAEGLANKGAALTPEFVKDAARATHTDLEELRKEWDVLRTELTDGQPYAIKTVTPPTKPLPELPDEPQG